MADLPLSTVGAIEFLGTVILAAADARTRRNLLALILAVGGVLASTDVRLSGQPWDFVFAFANCGRRRRRHPDRQQRPWPCRLPRPPLSA